MINKHGAFLTDTQFLNIVRLTLFCKDVKTGTKFEISCFSRDRDGCNTYGPEAAEYEDEPSVCGTSSCFCGFGPLAGIKPATPNMGWNQYSQESFGASLDGSQVWDYLFDAEHANNLEAAVRRGAYFIEHGLPERQPGDSFTYLCRLEAPADYQPNWELIESIATITPEPDVN